MAASRPKDPGPQPNNRLRRGNHSRWTSHNADMANHTTVETLARYLDENGLQYELQLEDERILLGVDGVPLIVRYRADAAVLMITVPNVLRAPQEGHGAPSPESLNTFLRYLMDANYKLMVGRFGWD